jgi:hypothetical protein
MADLTEPRLLLLGPMPREIDTVILAGSGIVADGWKPLHDAVLGFQHAIDPTYALASCVYRARASKRFITLNEGKPEANAATLENSRRAIQELHVLRPSVAKRYREAAENGQIRLVPTPNLIDGLASDSKTVFITTNWETLLEKRFPNNSILHLHGCVNLPGTIIFPTELALDEYREDYGESAGEADESIEHLKAVHALAIDWIAAATTIVLWGLALHTYDAELAVVLAEVTKATKGILKRNFIVVDPNLKPVEKLKFLTGAESIEHVVPPIPSGKA